MDRVTDALRSVAALSIVVAGLLYGWSGALVFVVVSAAVWVPRIATLAVLWEFYEGLRYHGQGAPFVGYNDTILDLLMGCIGSLVAGVGLAWWATAGWDSRRI